MVDYFIVSTDTKNLSIAVILKVSVDWIIAYPLAIYLSVFGGTYNTHILSSITPLGSRSFFKIQYALPRFKTACKK